MDRRDFVRRLAAAAAISPFLLGTRAGEGDGEVHLISDRPDVHLRPILHALGGALAPSTTLVLGQPQRPSFTLFRNGEVEDPRRLRLGPLWDRMREEPLSRLLTVASFGRPRRPSGRASSALVLAEGRTVDRLFLDKGLVRTYGTRRGRVTVRVDDRGVQVLESSCRHGICRQTPPVHEPGRRIICAPNRFIVEVEGQHDWDTFTG